jgi:iron complex outermembrane receptor protein
MMDSPYDDSFLTGLDYKITKIGNMVKSLSFKAFYSYVDHLMTNENRPSFRKTGASSNVFATNFGGKTELILEPNENLKIFTGVDANFIGRDGDRIRTIKIINGIPLPEPKIKVDKIWQDSKVNDIGIYAEAKYLFGDSGVLTAGLRTDFVTASINDPEKDFLELYEGQIDDQHEPNVSGTVSYVYTTGNSQWQFAFGRGVRTASMPERFINHFNIGSDPYEYVGNPYLKPEKNNQFEISFRQDNKRIDYGITAFYSILKDYISAVVDKDLPRKFMPTVPPLFAKRYINIDNAFQTGFEAFFNVKIIEDFEFQSDFAYTYGQNNDFDEPLPQVMPMTVHLGLLYDKDSYWFHLKSRIVSKQDRISETFMEKETPGFNTIDLSAGVKPLKGLSVGAAILNIFDTAFYEHLNFSYKNSSFLQGRIYEPGRNFTVYVNYSF